MKILVVTPHYYPEHFSITHICESFVKKGHEVLVVTNQPNYGFDGILKGYEKVFDGTINGVRVHRVKIIPRKESRLSIIRNYLSFWSHSRSYVKKLKEDFDVVYSMTLSPVIAASAANLYAKKHGVKHVLHCLDLWPESSVVTGGIRRRSLSYLLLHAWSKRIYSAADEILISSPSFADYLKSHFGLEENMHYVPQPSFSKNIEYVPSKSGETRFLYVGNIGKLQLVSNLIEGFSLTKSKKAKLMIIGMGSLSKSLNKQIQDLGLEGRVVYLGPMNQEKASPYYGEADFAVVSLKGDGPVGKTIPNKMVTAMGFAKPILAVIEGDGRKILEETGGAVLSNEEPQNIAKAIDDACLLSFKEREEMGKANLSYYKQHFELERVVDEIVARLKK